MQELLQTFPYSMGEGPSHHDEVFEAAGVPRAHYSGYMDQFLKLGNGEITRRWDKARRQIQENGVTFHVYGEQEGMERAWKLDPIPMLITAADWALLERGLQQRAELLNLVLCDIYGEQRLIRKGLLPPELIYANPAFLRPCQRLLPESRCRLHFHAADLARAPDGNWWIIDDRTQAPSGIGYALENRVVLSRFFAEIFRDANVERLAPFLMKCRELLLSLSGGDYDPSRVAVLSPGPLNEIFFEHAYLARFLGFNLVEGEDLTVRDKRVYLKTLEGLHEIRVILRKLDDDFCDPLELRGDSVLGVPGLAQAARAGNVAIANGLGSGALEAQALMPFLPSLCRHFFDEDLLLPSVATWWCGQPDEHTYVMEHFDSMLIKPAFPTPGFTPIRGDELTAEQKATWKERMRRRPYQFVAQEQVTLSSVPVWEDGRLESRHLTLRAHLVAIPNAGYSVMPGGLTRVTASDSSMDVSMQQGGGSKDTWVLTNDNNKSIPALRLEEGRITPARETNHLPSRVAENLFWIGRYVERALGMISLTRSCLEALIDENNEEQRFKRETLAFALEQSLGVTPGNASNKARAELPLLELIHHAVFDDHYPGSIVNVLRYMRRATRAVSDRFTNDCWRLLNRMENVLVRPDSGVHPHVGEIHIMLRELVILIAAFVGMIGEGMIRALSWRFLEIGRCIERTIFTASFLQLTMIYSKDSEKQLLLAVLEVTDCAMTYRSRYLNQMQAVAILDLLILDETNPHAIAFQLARLSRHVEHLPRKQGAAARTEDQRIALELYTRIRLAEGFRLAKMGGDSGRRELGRLLPWIAARLCELSDYLSHAYFSNSEPSRTLRANARVATEPVKAGS